MSDARHTKAELLAEVQRLRARLVQLEPGNAPVHAATGVGSDPQDHFRAVADYTYDMESWVAPDGRLLWVNLAVERLTGYSVDECLAMGDYPLPIVHEGDRVRMAAVFQGALAGSNGNDVPFRLRCKDGSVRWVAVSWQPLQAADGRGLGHRSSIRDISDRKEAEEALQAHRALLATIITHIPCGVYWKDREFRYRGCNAEFARAAGVADPAAIVGKTDHELAWEPEQTAWFRRCDERVLATGEALLHIEESERQADGRVAQLLTNKVPLRDADGQVCGVLGVDTDVSQLKAVAAELRRAHDELELRVQARTAELAATNDQLRREIAERVRVEEALRTSEERYRHVAELTSDFAYAFRIAPDGSSEAEWITDAFARVTGRDSVDLGPPHRLLELVHPDDHPTVVRSVQLLLAGKSSATEFRMVRRDGQVHWLHNHARPEWDETAHRVVRILGAAQDISQAKLAEEEARRHQAALMHMARVSTMGGLTAQLAHELNQPLCTIVGNAQTAQRLLTTDPPDIAETRAALDDIVTHGNRAADIIHRLRDFLRLQQPTPVVLNVQRVIEDIATLAEADARQHGASIHFEISPDLPAVRADPIQLQQIILNLVRNGLEAMMRMPPGTRALKVQAQREDSGGAVIRVSDLGPGLPEAVAARMFEPFFTTKPTGLGMGLVISRSIAESHGGKLSMTRNAGRGVTFHLALPAAAEDEP
ncbi:MAG: PAS domain S-box protein [Planctomycetota bacterium]